MRKVILCLLMCAMLLPLLAACGGGGEEITPSSRETWRAHFLEKADAVTVTDGGVTFSDGTGEV